MQVEEFESPRGHGGLDVADSGGCRVFARFGVVVEEVGREDVFGAGHFEGWLVGWWKRGCVVLLWMGIVMKLYRKLLVGVKIDDRNLKSVARRLAFQGSMAIRILLYSQPRHQHFTHNHVDITTSRTSSPQIPSIPILIYQHRAT